MSDPGGPLGGRHARPDALGKALGRTRYVAELAPPGTLYAALAVSTVASARVTALDLAPARRTPGVVTALSAADVPGENQIGVVFADQPLLAVDRVRMVGERLALVAARAPEVAWRAAAAVGASLDELPGVHDPLAALAAGSPPVHSGGNLLQTFRVERGDVAAAARRAAVVVEANYDVGGQEHAYLEPQACLALPEGRERITILASCQCPFYIQHAVARVLGLPLAAVRVEQAPTGGAFGGKEDYPSEPAACAALLAWHTGSPVTLLLPRELDMQATSKRHPVRIHHRWGADRDGKLLFAEVDTVFDAGAYAGLSTVVAERGNSTAIGPYTVPAVRVRTRVAYTNNLFGGAFRGFGAPQVSVAHEATLDRLGRALGLDPLEIRRRNLLDDRRRTISTGQRLPKPIHALELLERAAAAAGWDGSQPRAAGGDEREGLGVGLILYGCNLHHGGQRLDRSSAVVLLQPDASAIVRVGLTEMGQGNLAACQTIAAEALGLPPAAVEVCLPDTSTVADSGPTVASRGAHASGLAILDAVRRLRRRLDPVAAELLGCRPAEVELVGGRARRVGQPERSVPLVEVTKALYARRLEPLATGWYRSKPRPYDAETGQGGAYEFYAFACHVARVAVDVELGLVRVLEVTTAHDVGRVLHRDALEGQIEGGVVQGMGWAVTEELKLDRGRLVNASFTDYLIPTAADVPRVRIELVEAGDGNGPYGAKGLGEPSLIPTAAAIRNAVTAALGVEIDRTPLTPPSLVAALAAAEEAAPRGAR